METKKLVPLFTTDKLSETKAFYTEHFGFEAFFEAADGDHGYVALRLGGENGPEVAFMTAGGEGDGVADGRGIFYCFQVPDVDAEHARLVEEGVAIEQPPTDKPWGDRCMMVRDPNGILVYLGHPIPRSVEFEAMVK